MDCLDVITKLSIFSNVGILFWTSKHFKEIFVSKNYELEFKRDSAVEPITVDFSPLDFLKSLIYIEHILIIFQILLHIKVSGKPEWVIKGERDRNILFQQYYQKR